MGRRDSLVVLVNASRDTARAFVKDTAMWARLAFSLSVVLVLMCSLPNVNSSVPFKHPSKVSRRHV